MRIAVSGSHGSGKTTLVEAFLRDHQNFSPEPEPYVRMVEEFGEEFSAIPGVEDFCRQLDFNIARLAFYKPADNVIFERSPLDFLAYIHALNDLNRDYSDAKFIDSVRRRAYEALANLDLIVFLPLDKAAGIDFDDQEDLELRTAVDLRLISIFDDQLDLDHLHLRLVEACGPTSRRLQTIEDEMVNSGKLF